MLMRIFVITAQKKSCRNLVKFHEEKTVFQKIHEIYLTCISLILIVHEKLFLITLAKISMTEKLG